MSIDLPPNLYLQTVFVRSLPPLHPKPDALLPLLCAYVFAPLARETSLQGDLSLDHYDDSQHSKASLASGAPPGFPPVGNGSVGVLRVNSGGAAAAAPWGSGLGGGKSDMGGSQNAVVPGGIWLPTPRTQATSSFSPSSSTGAGGDGTAGASAGGSGARGRGDGDNGQDAASAGFFGSGGASKSGSSDELRCSRCSNTEAKQRAQVKSGRARCGQRLGVLHLGGYVCPLLVLARALCACCGFGPSVCRQI